jgi:hypothetical protein
MAALLLVPAATLAVLGAASWLSSSAWGWRLAGALALLGALLLLGVSLGLRRSIALESAAAANRQAEAELDEALLAAAGLEDSACGGTCDACGVDDCAVKALPRQ